MAPDSAYVKTSSPCRNVSLTLKDGSKARYTLRGLASNDEIRPWATFCESCFSYKTNPPPKEYFERHYYNDPSHESSLIRVAISSDDSNEIVSSVRIFVRQISSCNDGNDSVCTAGGIGEVCTSPNHRQRGLSRLLLLDAIDIMTRRQDLKHSLLHAAPAFFPVYQKVGYANVTSPWSIVSVDLSRCNDEAFAKKNHCIIRLAEFPQDARQLQRLHQVYSERHFCGCIIRTSQYWNEYIARELEGSLFVLENWDDNDDSRRIMAWLSIRLKDGYHVVAEFGRDRTRISTTLAMSLLLNHCIEQEVVELRLPTPVLEEIRQEGEKSPSFFDWTTEKSDNDDGWMYKTLQKDDTASMVDMSQNGTSRPHLIWPSDSF